MGGAGHCSAWGRAPPGRTLVAEALAALALALLGGAIAAAGLSHLLALGSAYPVGFVCVYLVLAAVVIGFLPRHRPQERFGIANGITLARGVVVALLATLWTGAGASPPEAWSWVAAILGITVLLLDGLDGRLARRHHLVSEFGARFDLEVDALLVLVLAGLVWSAGTAGAWVLLVGLARYGFLAAGRIWPRLGRPLPASRRRRAAFAAGVLGLVAALLPALGGGVSLILALAATLAIVVSFTIDLRWLLRAPEGRGASP
jgi:phosphatidylglycerophosphate synthase